MKKIFISAAAIIAFAACTKNEIVTPNEQINFAPATYSLNTKADAPVDQDDQGHLAIPGNFGVYAWFSPTTGNENQPFMVNESVTPEGIPAHTYYWPKDGKIDFVGYYPYGTCWFGVTNNPKSLATAYSYIAPVQTIIPAEGAAPDLMYADEAIGYDKENGNEKTHFYKGVPMLFHHALSQLTLRVQQSVKSLGEEKDAVLYETVEDYNTDHPDATISDLSELTDEQKIKSPAVNNLTTWKITLNWVKIDGIGNVGSVTIPSQKVWTVKEGSTLYTKKWEKATVLDVTPEKGTAPVYSNFENFLIMSQALITPAEEVKGQTITVNYTIETTRSWDDKKVTETVTSDPLAFKTGSITNWEMGKSYIYTLTFKPADETDIIKLDPAVVDWVSGGNETVTVY